MKLRFLEKVPDTLEELLSVDPWALRTTLKRDNVSAVKTREMFMQIPLQQCIDCKAYVPRTKNCGIRYYQIPYPKHECRCVFFRWVLA